MFRILVVDDNREFNHTVCTFLRQQGYDAVSAEDGNAALNLMHAGHFDLILSDIMMPGVDGYDLVKTVRSINQDIPILFMTAKEDFTSMEAAFRLGIDDYMVKPIRLPELALRIEAIMRRSRIAKSRRLEIGSVTLDLDERAAYLDGEPVRLTQREFDVLCKLLSYPKKTFTRTQLVDEFWGMESESKLRMVDVYIAKLRSKFADCSDFEIVTVHGMGYKAVIS